MLDLECDGATFHVVLEPLVDIDARGARTSVTTRSDWHSSVAWAHGRSAELGPTAFSAFVLNEVARAVVLGGAGRRAYFSLVATALTGRPRPRDLVRFAGRPLVLSRRAREGG